VDLTQGALSHLSRQPVLRAPGSLSGISTHLALVAFTLVMLARVITAAGAPGLVNFLHFPVTLGAALLVAPKLRDRESKRVVGVLYLLLVVIGSSAFSNGAGLINALLDFLLVSEPFLLLLLLTSSKMPLGQLRLFRCVALAVAAIHVAMTYYQYFALGLRTDWVKGVFLAQGAGHHVAGAVALTTAAYLLTSSLFSAPLRVAVSVACALAVYFTDAKQVTLVFLVSLFLLSFRGARFGAIIRRLGVATLVCASFLAAAQLLPGLVRGAGWGRVETVAVGLRHKLSVFPLLESHTRSPLNWLLGLGPGHTCGRLAELIPDYRARLAPLGVTTSPVTAAVSRLRESNQLSRHRDGSSLWSPFFFWSGLTGDLGLAGLACVLALWSLVWRQAGSDLTRFLVLNALLFGIVFSWLEEPGYTMFVMATIALARQEEWNGERGGRPFRLFERGLPVRQAR